MGELTPLFRIQMFGHDYGFSPNILIQWIIILLLALVSIFFTTGLKRIPGKKQSLIETVVEALTNFVKETMGEEYGNFVPYIGALALFLLSMNFTGLFGFKPPTMDYSVSLGMALTTFFVIQGYAIKKVGIGHYFLGYGKPMVLLLPMNILERGLLPVSLSLRLFGNMTAAATIMDLIYSSLGKVSFFAQIGIPILGHMYFDLFDGAIQMAVFTMLTMLNIKIISEH